MDNNFLKNLDAASDAANAKLLHLNYMNSEKVKEALTNLKHSQNNFFEILEKAKTNATNTQTMSIASYLKKKMWSIF